MGFRRHTSVVVMSLAVAALWSAGCGQEHESPPAAPTGLAAEPGNGQASLTWTASAGARTYNVYYSPTPPVTTSSPKLAVGPDTTAVVSALPNGVSHTFAVSAVSGAGEGPLSTPACAVPTASGRAGLTLYDGLCGTALDGQKWSQPGAYSMAVSGGAAVLSVDMANEEARSIRNNVYSALTAVNAGAQRVTTLQADITVPATTASFSGDGRIRALVRLLYSPPSKRLVFPGANLDLLVAEVGFIDVGSGLQAYRQVTHCDNASCTSASAVNVAFTDPAGFTIIGAGPQYGSPAAYGTTYTATLRLDEATGIFHWTIAGGTFGAGVSGTADPAAYLAATADWSGIPLAGAGFQGAQMGVRTHDAGSGGGSGKITGRFANVWVGFDDAAATAYDDFSGTGGNSGPVELSPAKWSNGGASSVGLSGGSLALNGQMTSTTGTQSIAPGVSLSNPTSFNTIQADVSIVSYSTSGSGGANAFVQGRFFNDGSAGAAPYSALGDVLAGVFLYPASNSASYMIGRCANATCSGAVSPVMSGSFTGVDVTAGVHALLVKWDPVLRQFVFGIDGARLIVNPTTTFTVAGPANAPFRRVMSSISTPGISAASAEVKVNNVFVAP